LSHMFASDAVRPTLTSLRSRTKDDPIELLDAAYWMKGCSSLGRLRYAALLRIGKGKDSSLCLVDVKEGVTAAAPTASKAEMPRDNAVRVVTGAKALSPNLGERMMAARLLGKAVVVRELMPQDLKIEINRLSREEAMSVATNIRAEERQGFDLVAFAAILATIITWASSFAAIRVCLGALAPVELAAARYVAAGAIAAVYLVVMRPPMPTRRDLIRLADVDYETASTGVRRALKLSR